MSKRWKVIKEIPGTGFKVGDTLTENYKVELSPSFLTEYFQEIPEESTRRMPKNLEEYWVVNTQGELLRDKWTGGTGDLKAFNIGNVFQTEKQAQDHALRLEAMAGRGCDLVKGQTYWFWNFQFSTAGTWEWLGDCGGIAMFYLGNMHKTRAEAEEYGRKFGKVFELPKEGE